MHVGTLYDGSVRVAQGAACVRALVPQQTDEEQG
jgi:hypothetical protein